ncbi:DUF6783 domain-containing protein [Enterocloster hominis (ex Hitch et al. 2024)]|uniref:DUF6783 domain-containing protein n=1 Tax=Enterocloster hominis (ex Hitch et al. 2024) TaxID=1917870 RepID=UPI00338FCF82
MDTRVLDACAYDLTQFPEHLRIDSGILYAVLTHETPLLSSRKGRDRPQRFPAPHVGTQRQGVFENCFPSSVRSALWDVQMAGMNFQTHPKAWGLSSSVWAYLGTSTMM